MFLFFNIYLFLKLALKSLPIVYVIMLLTQHQDKFLNEKNKQIKFAWLTVQELYKLKNIAQSTQVKYRKQRRDYLKCLNEDPTGESCKKMPKGIPYYKQAGKIFYKPSEIDTWIETGKVV